MEDIFQDEILPLEFHRSIEISHETLKVYSIFPKEEIIFPISTSIDFTTDQI